MSETEHLANFVRYAFRDVPAPTRITTLSEFTDRESSLVSAAFREKHWTNLTPQFVQAHPDAIAFFSPEAFRYFLPGYLLLALQELSGLDVSLVSLLNALAGPAQHEERLRLLDEAQLSAVLAVLDAITPKPTDAIYWNIQYAKEGVLEHLTRP